MIQFANEYTTPLVRQMWKVCFDDSDEFIDLYFARKYKNENTLVYFEDNKAVASLQMLPYTINFYKREIPFAYLAGLCTLPEHRQKGHMAKLIYESHRIMGERNIPLAILIPAEDWLFKFYEKYGYEQVFEKNESPIPLKDILNTYSDDLEAYSAFDSLFRPLDFCVQKSVEDFRTIKDEFKQDRCPEKTNLSGMARVIDIWTLLDLYAKDNLLQKFKIKINDPHFNKSETYSIDRGNVELLFGSDIEIDLEVDVRLLCKLLFGYKLQESDVFYHQFFSKHNPVMNLMLE